MDEGNSERLTSMLGSARPVALSIVLGALLQGSIPELRADWFHHGQTQTTTTVTRTSGHHHGVAASTTQLALVPTGQVTRLSLVPSSNLMVSGTMTGQTLQLVTLTNSPGSLTVSMPNTLQVSSGVSLWNGLMLVPQSPTTLKASSGSGPMTDYDYQVLTAGHGGSIPKFLDFEKVLKNKLEELIAQKGSILNQDEITTLLLDFAKGYLNSTGFGFLVDGAIEPILKRLIAKLFQERQAANGGGGSVSPTPSGNTIPAAGGTFDVTGAITGRIVLTPVNGPVPTPPAPVPNPPTPGTNTTLPSDLKKDGGTVAPSP
jgi:hypothetical protein